MMNSNRIVYWPWFAWPEIFTLLLLAFMVIIFSFISSLSLAKMIEINLWPMARILGCFWLFARAIDFLTFGPQRRRHNHDKALIEARHMQMMYERQQQEYERTYRP